MVDAAAEDGAEPSVVDAADPPADEPKAAIEEESAAIRASADWTTGPALSVARIVCAAAYFGSWAMELSKAMMEV